MNRKERRAVAEFAKVYERLLAENDPKAIAVKDAADRVAEAAEAVRQSFGLP